MIWVFIVPREAARERLQHLRLVLGFDHVDEINDDDAAQIAQPQLPRNGHGGLEIGAKYRFLEIAMTDVRARVDVDRRHRLGLIENQITTRFQGYFAL